MKDLGLRLAAQIALAGSSKIADPVELATRGSWIAALGDLELRVVLRAAPHGMHV